MASFDKDTPVLRFTKLRKPDVRWVLWPVLAWRVVAPVPQGRRLNLLQKAALGLVRAGVTTAQDVSERLLILPDLAALVLTELQGMRLVDELGALTPRGAELVDELDVDPPEALEVGHVLADPFTGSLWPRLLTGDLPLAEVEQNDQGWPVLLSGSPGAPWRDHAFCVLPRRDDAVVIARPGAKDILRAARRGRRVAQAMGDAAPALRLVSFIDERPEPYLAALPVVSHASGDWIVLDPFGGGASFELRRQVERRLDVQPGLRAWLAPLVGGDVVEATTAELQRRAAWEVEEQLTLGVRRFAGVHDHLVAMQRAWLEAQAWESPDDKVDDVLVKAQRAVEATIREVLRGHSDPDERLYLQLAPSHVKGYQRQNRGLLDDIAAGLGFASPLPTQLSGVKPGKVQSAEQSLRGSLRPLLLATLLAADRNDRHPLRRSASACPDLLERLDALASARDRAAHDGDGAWPERLPVHLETTYDIVRHLLLHNA
ncbi:MAG: hypothetical protein EP329_08950 [Deltaproteobacteria bacterium]|nr:MAG: hypothetical protein EP329_08950 [Deltaproteobacteria bacterium]